MFSLVAENCVNLTMSINSFFALKKIFDPISQIEHASTDLELWTSFEYRNIKQLLSVLMGSNRKIIAEELTMSPST